MKISVLTATYNRVELLNKLYKSILKNIIDNIEIEWLIMDDGSKDNTQEVVESFQNDNKIKIEYCKQKNQGKMMAINNLVPKVKGDLIIVCDSDDYFTEDAFKIIKEEYEKNKDNLDDVYALCFLKYDITGKNIGKDFIKTKTTMFDLYFKEGEDGEKALVFLSDIRKKYLHKLENNEKFITEARLYHEMDKKYKIICINKPIMICEYQKEGYTNNIKKQFIKNPFGYYNYFKEILEMDMNGVLWKKRLYVIKHFILFEYLTNRKIEIKFIKSLFNKVLYIVLRLPGRFLTKRNFKNNKI